MTQALYQVDAFTNSVFGGNPAAVCPLEKWIDDSLMQKIAMENNLAETAFYVKDGNDYQLRWFTPTVEVDLCGHATLAAAYVLFHHEGHEGDSIHFHSPRSGSLQVKKQGERLTLNFPTDILEQVQLPEVLIEGLGIRPQLVFKGKTDYLLVYANQGEIEAIQPKFDSIAKVGGRGVIVTAEGDEADFVSRFFAPQAGVSEDPVTGSAHTSLTPYWAIRLGKSELSAIQLSKRKGHLICKYLGERVEISGQARLYLKGEIFTS